MIFYAPYLSPRLRYVAEFIARELTGSDPVFTDDPAVLDNYPGIRINYSPGSVTGNAIHVQPHGLLTQRSIQQQQLSVFEKDGIPRFFQAAGDLDFDVLAAIFYLISRYEEYLPYEPDAYGRYPHIASLAFRKGFLHLPVIDHWLQELRAVIRSRFPGVTLTERHFLFVPTYDIDEAYSFRYKSWWRTAGGIAKDAFKMKWPLVWRRIQVMRKKTPDPYDAFQWMDELHNEFSLQPFYFFLLARKTGRYDKNILPSKKEMRQLVIRQASNYKTGIHPSWQSGDNKEELIREIETLRNWTSHPVTRSRQHFIRMTLPETYQILIDAGIEEDFSMGYGSINGFRASTSISFKWYNLAHEQSTGLLIHPFCFMEANSFFEQRQSVQQTLKELRAYHTELRKVNGTMVTLWHNTFLGTDPLFTGWRELYETFVREVSR